MELSPLGKMRYTVQPISVTRLADGRILARVAVADADGMPHPARALDGTVGNYLEMALGQSDIELPELLRSAQHAVFQLQVEEAGGVQGWIAAVIQQGVKLVI